MVFLQREFGNTVASKKPIKPSFVTSNYSPSSSSSSSSSPSPSSSYSLRRCPSPLLSRPTFSLNSSKKRSQSVERNRKLVNPKLGNAVSELSVSSPTKLSSRSFSVSFQGESFTLPVNKTKPVPPPSNSSTLTRKPTPERRRLTPLKERKIDTHRHIGGGGGQTVNSNHIDQHQWQSKILHVIPVNNNRSDFSINVEEKKVFESGFAPKSSEKMKPLNSSRLLLHLDDLGVERFQITTTLFNTDSSDTESISSSCNSSTVQNTPHDTTLLPPSYMQQNPEKIRRNFQEPSSRTPISSPKFIPLKKPFMGSPISSPRSVTNTKAFSSPLRGPMSPNTIQRPFSPSRRSGDSPLKMRNSVSGTISDNITIPSLLGFSNDLGSFGRGKMGKNRILDAHQLRLLYNRHLQWRFINARSDALLLIQRLSAERNIYNAWVTTSELRCSVTVKRIKLQQLRHTMKINFILQEQMAYLEQWVHLEKDNSTSLSGLVESLIANTLRLPIVCRAKADVKNLKDAISSAVDVMQATASLICPLMSKVEEMNALVKELATVTALERTLIIQCQDLLSMLAEMQVKDCSLRTHILQLERLPIRDMTMQV